MARILFCTIALAVLCTALASDNHHVKATNTRKVGHVKEVDRSKLKAHDAFSGIEAEDFDYSISASVYPADDPEDVSTDPQEIAFITSATELGYYDVDFGRGADRVELRLGQLYDATAIPAKAGTINIHLNSTDEAPFLSAIIDYGRVFHYVTISQSLDPLPSGVQSIFFSFDVDNPNDNLVNINWFKFYSAVD